MTDPVAAAGTLRDAYRRVDWATTSLGPVTSWSPALLAALDLTLHTRAPVTLFWGPDHVLVYNEAYVPMIGDKHPAALGAPAAKVFAEIWSTIDPMLESVLAGRGATWVEDLRLLMDRRGFLEETYFTFSYSAVHDSAGRIAGAIDIAAETTGQVLGARRLALLGRLNDQLADAEDVGQQLDHALPVLRSAPDDLPEVDIVLPEAQVPTAAWPAPLDRDVAVEITEQDRIARIRLTGADRDRPWPRGCTGPGSGRPSAAPRPWNASWPKPCSAVCSPRRCSPSTPRWRCGTSRPARARTSAATGTTRSPCPTAG
ncbi:hypothetical protein ACQP2Y_23880 [Actinoplanes sp. CA-051413]|uniref:hypothetical protein n=1 Tax=Actinoplanes sp. CA-051413 TaxID=3239899 RepID=UPI003D98E46B